MFILDRIGPNMFIKDIAYIFFLNLYIIAFLMHEFKLLILV